MADLPEMSYFVGEQLHGEVYLPDGQRILAPYQTTAADYECMAIAVEEASLALETGNMPVGAVLVNSKGDIWRGHADEHSSHRLNGHAERNVIEKYNLDTGILSIQGLTMYTTLVPCVGCAHVLDQGELSTMHFAADRQDVKHVTDDGNGNGAVRERAINMPDILVESPRTMLVVSGLMKASALELFKRRSERKVAEQEALRVERRRSY